MNRACVNRACVNRACVNRARVKLVCETDAHLICECVRWRTRETDAL